MHGVTARASPALRHIEALPPLDVILLICHALMLCFDVLLSLEEAMSGSPAAKRPRRSDERLKAPPWIVGLLPSWLGCGPSKRAKLAGAFETEDMLRGATVEQLSRIKGISKAMAEKVRDFLDGKLIPPTRIGDTVSIIEMWNTRTKSKCPYPSSPKTEEAARIFLEKYPYYERYDGQDADQEPSLNHIPDDHVLSHEAYQEAVLKSAFASQEELQQKVEEYKLQLGDVYTGDDAAATSPGSVPAAPLFKALSHASLTYGHTLDAVALQSDVAARLSSAGMVANVKAGRIHLGELTAVLEAAQPVFGRPLWVFSPTTAGLVYVVDGSGIDPAPLPPICIGQCGESSFAAVFSAGDIPAPLMPSVDGANLLEQDVKQVHVVCAPFAMVLHALERSLTR